MKPPNKKWYKRWWAITLFIMVGLAIIGSFIPEDTSQTESQQGDVLVQDEFSNVEEIHFTKLPITYSINLIEGDYEIMDSLNRPFTIYTTGRKTKIEDIRKAFQIIENSTDGIVRFEEVGWGEEPDIRVHGIFPPQMEDLLNTIYNDSSSDGVLGLGLYENETNQIINGSIYFQPIRTYWQQADWINTKCIIDGKVFPATEIHEILHVLGFRHRIDNINKIMFPIALYARCNVKEIDQETIDCLKKIYSNGETEGDCSDLNIPPYLKSEEETEIEDFAWQGLPVTYTISNCSTEQKRKIEKVVKQFENVIGKENFLIYQENIISQINFACGETFYAETYSSETEYYDNFKPALEKEYVFSDGQVSQVNIKLLYDKMCPSYNDPTDPTQLELFALYRAIGLRNDYGSDMIIYYCYANSPSYSSITLDRIRELYNLEKK